MTSNLNNLIRLGGAIAILATVVSVISFTMKGTGDNTYPPPLETIEGSPTPQAIELASKKSEASATPLLSMRERQQIIRAIEANQKVRENTTPTLTAAGGRTDLDRDEQRRKDRETNPVTSRFAAIEDIYHEIGGAVMEQGSQRFNRIMEAIHNTDIKDELSTVDSVFLTEEEKAVYDATYSAGEPRKKTVMVIGNWLQSRFEKAQMELTEGTSEDFQTLSENIRWLESAAEQLQIPLKPDDSEWENVAFAHIAEIARENALFHAATDPFSVAVINGDALELERLVGDIGNNPGK